MIVFELDNVLADIEHRRHLLNPEEYYHLYEYSNYYINRNGSAVIDLDGKSSWRCKKTGVPFKHGKEAYHAACHKDGIILPLALQFYALREKFGICHPIQIWTQRCESMKGRTIDWLQMNFTRDIDWVSNLKMRPVGDDSPAYKLKENWLDEYYKLPTMDFGESGISPTIDFVFESDPESIAMYRRRGIFVFDCNQGK